MTLHFPAEPIHQGYQDPAGCQVGLFDLDQLADGFYGQFALNLASWASGQLHNLADHWWLC